MQITKSLLAAFIVCLGAIASGQKNTPRAMVEMQYCDARPGRPPLKYLSFNVTMKNPANKARWFLFPRALYENAPGPPPESGVDGVEIFSTSDRKVTVAQFMGSIRLQPESAGGFQALLLPPGGAITIRDFGISFWGDNFSSLSLKVVIADQVMIGSVPADRWTGARRLLSATSADVSTKQISITHSKFTQRHNEVPVTIQWSGEVTVANAMAKRCDEGKQ